jgi:uncharacterized membrane protein YjfL (UPF0719 family)
MSFLRVPAAFVSLFTCSTLAYAGPVGSSFTERLWHGVADTLIYTFLGLIMMVIAFKVKDALLPGDLGKQLIEEKNVAMAIVTAAFIIGISLIIAAAISG